MPLFLKIMVAPLQTVLDPEYLALILMEWQFILLEQMVAVYMVYF